MDINFELEIFNAWKEAFPNKEDGIKALMTLCKNNNKFAIIEYLEKNFRYYDCYDFYEDDEMCQIMQICQRAIQREDIELQRVGYYGLAKVVDYIENDISMYTKTKKAIENIVKNKYDGVKWVEQFLIQSSDLGYDEATIRLADNYYNVNQNLTINDYELDEDVWRFEILRKQVPNVEEENKYRMKAVEIFERRELNNDAIIGEYIDYLINVWSYTVKRELLYKAEPLLLNRLGKNNIEDIKKLIEVYRFTERTEEAKMWELYLAKNGDIDAQYSLAHNAKSSYEESLSQEYFDEAYKWYNVAISNKSSEDTYKQKWSVEELIELLKKRNGKEYTDKINELQEELKELEKEIQGKEDWLLRYL